MYVHVEAYQNTQLLLNNMKVEYLKIILSFLLVSLLIFITYKRIVKLGNEEVIRNRYVIGDGALLPAFTICFYFFNQEETFIGSNVSFSKFMNQAYDIRKFISKAIVVEDSTIE